MLIQYKRKPFFLRIQLGKKEYIDLVDHLLELMKHQPERFVIGEHVLVDMDTKWEYWICNGASYVGIWRPDKGTKWGYWQGRRFLRGIKKYLDSRYKEEETIAWRKVYLTEEEDKKVEFAKVYNDHSKLHEKHTGLKELYKKYLAFYYLCDGKEK